MTKIITIFILVVSSISFAQETISHWGKTLGSKGYDYPYSTTLSNHNEVLTVAYFEKDSVIVKDTENAQCKLTLTQKGTYLIKLDSLGSVHSTVQISPNNLIVSSLATTDNDELIIAGNYKDTLALNTTNGHRELHSKGDFDFCLLKMNSNYEITEYATWGNEYEDRVHHLKIDHNGNIFVSGFVTGEVDLNPSSESRIFKTEHKVPNGYVIKLNNKLAFIWAQHYSNSDYAQCKALAIDDQNMIYVTGYFYGQINIPDNTNQSPLQGNGRLDIFVSKLTAEGQHVWLKKMGYEGYDSSEDIEIDDQNNIYIAASFEINPLLNNWHPDYYRKAIHNQAAVIKLNTDGEEQWVKTFAGPNAWASATSITIDKLGHPIVAGYATEGADMVAGDTTFCFSYEISDYYIECGFIEALDSDGNFLWTKKFGSKGKQSNNIYSSPTVISDKNNNIYSTNISYKAENDDIITDDTDNYSNVEIIKLHQCTPIHVSLYDTVCQSYTDLNGETFYTSGNYSEYLTTYYTGCDSIITHYITVNPSYYIVKDTLIYEGTDMIVSGEYFTENETYIEYLTCANTICDSTVIWNITVTDSLLFEVTKPQEACENSILSIDYNILAGIPNKYRITFSNNSLDAGFTDTEYKHLDTNDKTGNVMYNIPEKVSHGTYIGYLQLLNSRGRESQKIPFLFTIKLSSDFIHFGDVNLFLFNNSSENFVDYQWYKNGLLLKDETKQYYYDEQNEEAYYTVRVVNIKGDTLYTCPKYYTELGNAKSVKVYPNPLPLNMPCHAQLMGFESEDLSEYTITVKDINGNVVFQTTEVTLDTVIKLPSQLGLFIGFLTNAKGESIVFKIIKTT